MKFAKVIFLHLSVILFTGGVSRSTPGGVGWEVWPGGCPGPHPGWSVYSSMHWGRPPPPADGYWCGRYASYWNALFLLINSFFFGWLNCAQWKQCFRATSHKYNMNCIQSNVSFIVAPRATHVKHWSDDIHVRHVQTLLAVNFTRLKYLAKKPIMSNLDLSNQLQCYM